MDRLGKILYPNLDRWQRRRQVKMILIAIFTGLVFAGLVGLAMVLKNSSLNN